MVQVPCSAIAQWVCTHKLLEAKVWCVQAFHPPTKTSLAVTFFGHYFDDHSGIDHTVHKASAISLYC